MTNGIAMQTHLDWERVYERYGPELRPMEELIQSFERERSLTLTPGAIEILLIPLIESLDIGNQYDYASIAETFRTILSQVADEPDARDLGDRRSSWSILLSIWKHWCNIPPFCRER